MGARFNTKYVPQFNLWIDVNRTPEVRTTATMAEDLDIRLIRFPASAEGARAAQPPLTEGAKGRGFFGLLLRSLAP
jgi:hypothetical protein